MVGIIHHDADTTLLGRFTRTGAHHHAGGSGLRKLAEILGVTEETQIVGASGLQCGQAFNHDVRVTQQFSIGLAGQGLQNVGEAQRHTAPSMLLTARAMNTRN